MRIFDSRAGDYRSINIDYNSPQTCFAQGRNGWMYCVGLQLEAKTHSAWPSREVVIISPINKRCVSSAVLEVPSEDLDQVIEALQNAREFMRSSRQTSEENIQTLD